ncbi:MAG: winged helix-turn-helix domain-containing protein [Gemmatimonadota bacterium]
MRIRTAALSKRSGAPPGIGLLTDRRIRRTLRRHARLAALALRSPEAYAVIGSGGDPILGASYGRTEPDSVEVPDEIRSTPLPDGKGALKRPTPALGAPIRTPDGEQYGTLWVVGDVDRRWTRRERRLLTEIASCAAEEIELRSALSGSVSAHLHAESGDYDSIPARALLRQGTGELLSSLRSGILTAINEGHAEAGTRLPSIREVADLVETSRYSVLQAYRSLESEGIVETRHRSGVYVASLGESPDPQLPETARWLGRVITESYLHKVKLPSLPALIGRWTSSTTIRCACAESNEDYRYALADEVRTQFGLEAVAVEVPGPSADGTSTRTIGQEAERLLASADIVVTTAFHAPVVGSVAERLGIPLIVATLDESSSTVVPLRLRNGSDLAVICADPAFGRRIMSALLPPNRSRVRILSIDDIEELRRLDRREPVLITGAAKARLQGEDFRLLAARYPTFSRRFAERLASVVLEINLRGPGARAANAGR